MHNVVSVFFAGLTKKLVLDKLADFAFHQLEWLNKMYNI